MLIRAIFWRFRVSDTQCGCKVVSRAAVSAIMPRVRNTGWFFDTEMLLLACSSQMRVSELGVAWLDDRDSRVKVLATMAEMALGLVRIRCVREKEREREREKEDYYNSSSRESKTER